MIHDLKIWPQFFQPMLVGDKNFEIRKNDRDFKERDQIMLREWDPQTNAYTSRVLHFYIRYISDFEQKDNYVVLGLCRLDW